MQTALIVLIQSFETCCVKDKPENITPEKIGEVIRQPAYIVRAVRGPIQSFIHTEEVGALFLLVAAAVALVWINSPWSASYVDFWHIKISFDIHVFAISEDLRHLVNEGLMAVFFFVVGLEIKRELVHGELSTFRKAILPAVAAIGGMSAPALIYVLFNYSGDYLVGWGIPMATDIAFAVGVLALLGRRVPPELRVFLLGLAIVDDLGAIGVIAVFYTEAINWANLGLGVGFFAVIALCVRFGIRSIGFYLVMCVVMWQFFLESGIHATLAGVLIAAIVPSKPDLLRKDYASAVKNLLHDFRLAMANKNEEKAQTIVAQIEDLSRGTEEPLERLEATIHPWVSFVVLPLFALANAAIIFDADTLSAALESQVTLGIALGLLIGNPIGILGLTWLAIKFGLAELPTGVGWRHILGVGFLAGIGFTVAIFISGIAFNDPSLVDQAKLGVFAASLLAGAVGYLLLRTVGGRTPDLDSEL